MAITVHWWMLAIAIPIACIIVAIRISEKSGDWDFVSPLLAICLIVGGIVSGICIAIGHFL